MQIDSCQERRLIYVSHILALAIISLPSYSVGDSEIRLISIFAA
ncbi:hypothetical protein [Labilibaculum sp.]|nr:hypothetical protein [Labilibaculum sp.]